MGLFNRHKHNWKVIRVLQGELSYKFFGGGHPVTQIYWKCDDCGKTDMTTKDGLWEVTDFD